MVEERVTVLGRVLRARILALVGTTPGLSVNALAQRLGADHKTVESHVRALEEMGLVVRGLRGIDPPVGTRPGTLFVYPVARVPEYANRLPQRAMPLPRGLVETPRPRLRRGARRPPGRQGPGRKPMPSDRLL